MTGFSGIWSRTFPLCGYRSTVVRFAYIIQSVAVAFCVFYNKLKQAGSRLSCSRQESEIYLKGGMARGEGMMILGGILKHIIVPGAVTSSRSHLSISVRLYISVIFIYFFFSLFRYYTENEK